MSNFEARPYRGEEVKPVPGPSMEDMMKLAGKGREMDLGEKSTQKRVESDLLEMKKLQKREAPDRQKEIDEAEKMMAFIDTLDKSNPDAKFIPVENVTPEQAEKGLQDQYAFMKAEDVEKEPEKVITVAKNKE